MSAAHAIRRAVPPCAACLALSALSMGAFAQDGNSGEPPANPAPAAGETATQPAPSSSLDLTLETGADSTHVVSSSPAAPTAAKPAAPPHRMFRVLGQPLASRSATARAELRQPAMSAPRVLAQIGLIVAGKATMRVTVDPNARLLSVVPKGTYVAIVAQMGSNWGVLMANNTVGWTPKSLVELIDYQTEVSAPTDPSVAQAAPSAAASASGYLSGLPQNMDARAYGALRDAFSYLGVPYVWGGEGRAGLDCSAFVRNVFATQGVRLPRHSGDQIAVGREVQGPELRAGDRLYFDCSSRRSGIDHTGIYLGNGLFIHASGGKGQVTVDSLFKPLYYKGLVAARRDFE